MSLLSFFSSLIKPKDIEFVEAKELKFGNLYNGILPLEIIVVLKNPNNISALLQSVQFDLYCWNRRIGGSQQTIQKEIGGNEVFDISLNLDLSAIEVKEILKNDFLNIITDGSVNIPLRITGKTTIRKLGFNLNIPLEINKEFELRLDTILQKIKL